MWVLSIKVAIRKKSGNLFNDPNKYTPKNALDITKNNLMPWLHPGAFGNVEYTFAINPRSTLAWSASTC